MLYPLYMQFHFIFIFSFLLPFVHGACHSSPPARSGGRRTVSAPSGTSLVTVVPVGGNMRSPSLTGANQIGITAEEAVISNIRMEFIVSVIIDNNGTVPKVHALTHGCISHIGQMCNLGSISDFCFFQLYKVTDT